MTRASSSGIARVWEVPSHMIFMFTDRPEFLPGDSTADDCASLFKDYKTCLTVSAALQPSSQLIQRI